MTKRHTHFWTYWPTTWDRDLLGPTLLHICFHPWTALGTHVCSVFNLQEYTEWPTYRSCPNSPSVTATFAVSPLARKIWLPCLYCRDLQRVPWRLRRIWRWIWELYVFLRHVSMSVALLIALGLRFSYINVLWSRWDMLLHRHISWALILNAGTIPSIPFTCLRQTLPYECWSVIIVDIRNS